MMMPTCGDIMIAEIDIEMIASAQRINDIALLSTMMIAIFCRDEALAVSSLCRGMIDQKEAVKDVRQPVSQ